MRESETYFPSNMFHIHAQHTDIYVYWFLNTRACAGEYVHFKYDNPYFTFG